MAYSVCATVFSQFHQARTRFVEAHEWLGLLNSMMGKRAATDWVALPSVPPLDQQSFDNQALLHMVMGRRMVVVDGDDRRPSSSIPKVVHCCSVVCHKSSKARAQLPKRQLETDQDGPSDERVLPAPVAAAGAAGAAVAELSADQRGGSDSDKKPKKKKKKKTEKELVSQEPAIGRPLEKKVKKKTELELVSTQEPATRRAPKPVTSTTAAVASSLSQSFFAAPPPQTAKAKPPLVTGSKDDFLALLTGKRKIV